jgi:hypothetical protein
MQTERRPAPQPPRPAPALAVPAGKRSVYAPPRVVSFAMDAESRKASLSFNGNG